MNLLRAAALMAALMVVAPVAAQGQRGRLLVTVADTTGAVIPDAKVGLVGLDDATKAVPAAAVQSSSEGIATFTGLVPGRYSIVAEFSGFEMGLLREVPVRAGDNKRVVVLKIQGLQETVTVAQDGQAAASSRAATSFGVKLSEDQLAALSDDPEELARQLKEMAGPSAIIRVDSFEGMQLPPKSQIKSVHVTRDQFAAESPYPGDTFIEIITAPGIGPIRGGFNANVRAGGLSSRSPFTPEKGPDHNQRFGLNVGGALKQNKSSFTLNFNHSLQYAAPTLNAIAPGGGIRAETLKLRTPAESYNVALFMDYAVTRDQTLRFGYYDNDNVRRNAGVGDYDALERAYTSKNGLRYYRIQHAGPIGRRIFINNRLFVGAFRSRSKSAVEAPTIRVLDALDERWRAAAGRQPAARISTCVRSRLHPRHSFVAHRRAPVRDPSEVRYRDELSRYVHVSRSRSLRGGDTVAVYAVHWRPTRAVFRFRSRRVHPGRHSHFEGADRESWYPLQHAEFGAVAESLGAPIRPHVGADARRQDDAPGKRGDLPQFSAVSTLEQTIRIDGVRQRELHHPEPVVSRSRQRRCCAGDEQIPPRRLSAAEQHPLQCRASTRTFSPQFRVNALYNYIHQTKMARGNESESAGQWRAARSEFRQRH